MAEKIRILHVDDERKWLNRVKEVLTAEGYEVYSFAALDEAQAAAQEVGFDIFICDMRVHEMYDGSDWAYELQKAGKVAIVFSTLPTSLIPYAEKGTHEGREELVRLVKELAETAL